MFDLDEKGVPKTDEGRAAFNKKRVCESIQCVSVPEDRNLMKLLNYSYPKLHNLYVGTIGKNHIISITLNNTEAQRPFSFLDGRKATVS